MGNLPCFGRDTALPRAVGGDFATRTLEGWQGAVIPRGNPGLTSLRDDLFPRDDDAIPGVKDFGVGRAAKPIERGVAILEITAHQLGKGSLPQPAKRILRVKVGNFGKDRPILADDHFFNLLLDAPVAASSVAHVRPAGMLQQELAPGADHVAFEGRGSASIRQVRKLQDQPVNVIGREAVVDHLRAAAEVQQRLRKESLGPCPGSPFDKKSERVKVGPRDGADDGHRHAGVGCGPNAGLGRAESAGQTSEAVMKFGPPIYADVNADPVLVEQTGVARREQGPVGADGRLQARDGGGHFEHLKEASVKERFSARQKQRLDAERRAFLNRPQHGLERQLLTTAGRPLHVAMAALQVAATEKVQHQHV